jgi:hypothetical protein
MMTPDELLATVKHHATADIDPFALWAGLRSARDDITRLAWVIETQRGGHDGGGTMTTLRDITDEIEQTEAALAAMPHDSPNSPPRCGGGSSPVWRRD